MNTPMDLADAWGNWKKKRSIKNLIEVYRKGFTGGCTAWKICRFIINLISGKYERFYQAFYG